MISQICMHIKYDIFTYICQALIKARALLFCITNLAHLPNLNSFINAETAPFISIMLLGFIAVARCDLLSLNHVPFWSKIKFFNHYDIQTKQHESFL